MNGMSLYYVSRTVLTALFVLLLALSGMVWWHAVLIGFVILGLFIWAPRSGRYAVHPEFGVTALRRDERTLAINDKAARNAFVVTMLAVAACDIYFWSLGIVAVPIRILQLTLVLGALTYIFSDFFLRRST